MKRTLIGCALLWSMGCMGYEGDPDMLEEAGEEVDDIGEIAQASSGASAPNLRLDGVAVVYGGKSYPLTPGQQLSLPCAATHFTVSYGYANTGSSSAGSHQNTLAFGPKVTMSPKLPLQGGIGRFGTFEVDFGNIPVNTYTALSLKIDDPDQVYESNPNDNRLDAQVRRTCMIVPL